MAEITDGEILRLEANELGLQAGAQSIPTILEQNVRAVYPINPKYADEGNSISKNTTGSVNVITGKVGKFFYITEANLYLLTGSTSDTTGATLTYVQGGQTKTMLSLLTLASTAQIVKDTIAFPFPIKCDANTNVAAASTFTVGSQTMVCHVSGFFGN